MDEHAMHELSQIVDLQVKDRLSKLEGVSGVMISGERRYSMRVWIDNDQAKGVCTISAKSEDWKMHRYNDHLLHFRNGIDLAWSLDHQQ